MNNKFNKLRNISNKDMLKLFDFLNREGFFELARKMNIRNIKIQKEDELIKFRGWERNFKLPGGVIVKTEIIKYGASRKDQNIIKRVLWAKDAKGKVDLESPFTLGPALKFGAFFALILALVKVADVYLSSKGVYVVSFISGLADVDAITVSLSQLAKGELALETAKRGIMIATLTNVGVKGGIAYLFGGKKFGRSILAMFSLIIVVGLVLMFSF